MGAAERSPLPFPAEAGRAADIGPLCPNSRRLDPWLAGQAHDSGRTPSHLPGMSERSNEQVRSPEVAVIPSSISSARPSGCRGCSRRNWLR